MLACSSVAHPITCRSRIWRVSRSSETIMPSCSMSGGRAEAARPPASRPSWESRRGREHGHRVTEPFPVVQIDEGFRQQLTRRHMFCLQWSLAQTLGRSRQPRCSSPRALSDLNADISCCYGSERGNNASAHRSSPVRMSVTLSPLRGHVIQAGRWQCGACHVGRGPSAAAAERGQLRRQGGGAGRR